MTSPCRLFLVDDHPMLTQSLAARPRAKRPGFGSAWGGHRFSDVAGADHLGGLLPI
ncbi:hypothetical protein ACW9KT_22240 [Hymenobacter sp. HD11105]